MTEAAATHSAGERSWTALYAAATGVVLVLMMALGLIMRLAQAGWLTIGADRFYQMMTVHGVGMVGIAALGGVAVMWRFLSRQIKLTSWVLAFNLALFTIGVAAMLWADFMQGFAGGWTFLYPLPRESVGTWSNQAATLHLTGLLLVGVGFLVVFLDVARALIARYGGLGVALGWRKLFLNSDDSLPTPTAVASAMVAIVATASLIAGAIIIVMNIINIWAPAIAIDPLLAKNLTYFFGHVFINATIYMTVIVVYELLPLIAKRPWRTTRVFVAAWTTSTLMVLSIYPHHLLMDFVMPTWALALGQVLSYINSFPVLLVTGIGALAILSRSGIKWDLLATLLFVAMFGWMAGVVPAVVDATIAVNSVMHNTMWVPGHFHFYLLLGLCPMLFAFMIYLMRGDRVEAPAGATGDWPALIFLLAGLGFVIAFLGAGWAGVPRRWAEHVAEWRAWDQAGAAFAVIVVALTTMLVARFLISLPRLLAPAQPS